MGAEALHIELLHACRLRCLACDHRLAGPGRLSAAALKPIFSAEAFRDLRLVSFSGGEPLLHPELPRILREAAAAWPQAALVLLTSLLEGPALIKALRTLSLAALARLHVGSSLDGPRRVHDAMRGLPGAFSELSKNHAALKKAFPSLSSGFTFTATRLNAAFFYEAWLEAREMGAELGVQFLVPNAGTAGLSLRPRDRAALAAGLRAALRETPSVHLAAALAFLRPERKDAPCGAGRTFFLLSPEGLFYLCPFYKDITAPLAALGGLRRRFTGQADSACSSCFLRCAV